ncbi:MAG: rhomboid family intramembrane serine protease [Roseburia sp.]|nr:rhomboid family intramembrane serine protease [Roseburia sp.]
MAMEIKSFMEQQGYRYLEVQPEGADVFYKYYREGFHVVLAVDFTRRGMTAEQHSIMENRLMDFFYHPQGRLGDFPEGFPVYHVELLTLLLGGDEETVRRMCAETKNVWAYRMPEGRLVIYENQPGDFFGLRNAIEEFSAGKSGNTHREKPLKESVRSIKNLPVATIAITAANVLVYVILEIMGDTEDGFFIASHGGMYPEFLTYNHQWWRLFTAMFIHFGLEHLLNNMVIFCCVGSRLERAVGHVRLLLFYLLSGIGGGLLSYLMMERSGDYAVSAGASGAVFGTIGALLWAVIWHRGRFEGLTTRGLLVMLALSLYYGFATIGVDNWCHIGGMVTGFVAAAIFYHGKAQKY